MKFLQLLGAVIVTVALLVIMAKVWWRQRRRAALLARYGDAEIVERILRRMFWTGQTSDQLLESLGRPADIDQKVLKTKVKELWKYFPTGRNRFGSRITLDDHVVTGWDQKD